MSISKKVHESPFHSAKEEISITEQEIKLRERYLPAFRDQDFLLWEELRPVRLQLELLKPELVLTKQNINETIVFFGSARIPEEKFAKKKVKELKGALKIQPDNTEIQQALRQAENVVINSTYLKEAEKLAYIISTDKKSTFVVLSGGGPSFMEAANKGAHKAKARSISLNMTLSAEQFPNRYVYPELTFQFHYFAIRKMHFLLRAKALIVFPGGYGTMDELFEVLTLMQTKKIERIPLLLFRKDFWKKIINFEGLVEEGTIDAADLQLIQLVETAEEAWDAICNFYHL